MSGYKLFQRGGYGVDVKIHSFDQDGVYVRKDENCATYVLVADDNGGYRLPDGTRVDIVSVNGIGEIRWTLGRIKGSDDAFWAAAAVNARRIPYSWEVD